MLLLLLRLLLLLPLPRERAETQGWKEEGILVHPSKWVGIQIYTLNPQSWGTIFLPIESNVTLRFLPRVY